MTSGVAILALILSARAPAALVLESERIPLGPLPAAAALDARPLERVIRVTAGGRAAALARQLAGASRLCPRVTAQAGEVVLACTTPRFRAVLVPGDGGSMLELDALRVPPWRQGEDGPPLAAFDVAALGLGRCPGATDEAAGECALAAGDLATARARFEAATRAGDAPLARLRLGDLALADDDPVRAAQQWREVRQAAPWDHLASARLCELDPRCLASGLLDSVFDPMPVERAFRGDLVLRRARLTAFGGDVVAAARALAGEADANGACQAAPLFCRRMLRTALRLPPPDGAAALAIYLELPGRTDGPLAVELVREAAGQAEAAGAPVFAANLLANLTARIPEAELEGHLLRTAGLYLDGGDRVRAGELYRFARTRFPAAAHDRGEWARVHRALAPAPASAAAAPSPQDPDLAAARAALEAARLAEVRQGPGRR